MHLFVAAPSSGGPEELSWTIEGELVHFPPFVCARADCGCHRLMAGLASHRATTTFTVRDLDIDAATFTELLWDSLLLGGWVTEGDVDDRNWVTQWATEHVDMAAEFQVETPLTIHRGRISVRRPMSGLP